MGSVKLFPLNLTSLQMSLEDCLE